MSHIAPAPRLSTAIKKRPGNDPSQNSGYMRLLGRSSTSNVPKNEDVPPYQTPNYALLAEFMKLDMRDVIQAEYVWVGGNNELRSKTKTLHSSDMSDPRSGQITLADLPIWNYDGSSTDQAPGSDSEVLLKPCAVFPDPFRPGGRNVLVLCDCYLPDPNKPNGLGGPIPTNTRFKCAEIMDKVAATEPWFGIEQEYNLFEPDGYTPLGFPKVGFPPGQGPYYCGIGAENAFGRCVAEAHYRSCVYAGITISGINAEVMPGQWEFQVGPCLGIESGDHVLMARYILVRVAEQFQVRISFDPKPIEGDWNGAGCHTNVSTKEMRAPGGYDIILKAMDRLGAPGKQEEHIKTYDISGGSDNTRRLTGAHETAPITTFSYGVANRGCSVRIPRMTEKEKCGYFEDRRPASNMDPYRVTGKIMETCVLPDAVN